MKKKKTVVIKFGLEKKNHIKSVSRMKLYDDLVLSRILSKHVSAQYYAIYLQILWQIEKKIQHLPCKKFPCMDLLAASYSDTLTTVVANLSKQWLKYYCFYAAIR